MDQRIASCQIHPAAPKAKDLSIIMCDWYSIGSMSAWSIGQPYPAEDPLA
jgi:hypothetical protein